MARPLRLDAEALTHHITSRGNERKRIFREKRELVLQTQRGDPDVAMKPLARLIRNGKGAATDDLGTDSDIVGNRFGIGSNHPAGVHELIELTRARRAGKAEPKLGEDEQRQDECSCLCKRLRTRAVVTKKIDRGV
jgi:hypothetical protein